MIINSRLKGLYSQLMEESGYLLFVLSYCVFFFLAAHYFSADPVGSSIVSFLSLITFFIKQRYSYLKVLGGIFFCLTLSGIFFLYLSGSILSFWRGFLLVVVICSFFIYCDRSYVSLFGKRCFLNLVFFVFLTMCAFVNDLSSYGSAIFVMTIQVFFASVLFSLYGASNFRSGIVFIFVLTFLLMLFSNLSASENFVNDVSYYRIFYFICNFLFFAFLMFFIGKVIYLNDIFRGMLFSLLILSCYYVYFWHSLVDPFYYDWVHETPFFKNIRHQGYFLAAVCPVVLFFFFRCWKVSFALRALVLVFCLSLLLWNGGRGALLAVFTSFMVLFFLYKREIKLGPFLLFIMSFFISVFVSYLFRVDQRSLGWLSAFEKAYQAENVNAASSGRIEIWLSLIDYILQKPFFGWGGDGFIAVVPHYGLSQAHNLILQLLIEWGIAGTLCIILPILIVYIKGFISLYRGDRDDMLVVGFLISTSLLVLSLFDGVFYYAQPGVYLTLGLALIASSVLKLKHNQLCELK